MDLSSEAQSSIVACLQHKLPDLLAVYAFGSRVHGTSNAKSDLDLAVLVSGYVDINKLWLMSSEIADLVGCDVDLLDLRKASTVIQYQVVMKGERLWAKDSQAALYESAILSEKTDLDARRAALMADIQKSGSVYAR